MKTILAVALLSLVGCSTYDRHVPASVAVMPTDCGNRVAIINWYESQLAVPRPPLQNERAYEDYRAQIRYRVWHLRYQCQPV
jgi:hypothetical protein